MQAIETPIRKCFSFPGKEGSFYHEYNESNKEPHSVHEYDKYGIYVQNSTKPLSSIENRNDYFVSDRFGHKL